MTESYKSIANRQWDDIPEPKTLPVGSYLLKALGAKYFPAQSEDGSPTVKFFYSVVEAMDDVDEDDLKALGDNYDLSINKVNNIFWINDDGDWQKVKRHLAKLDVEVSGMSVPESLKAVKGAEVVAYLDERTYTTNDGEEVTENTPTNFTKPE